MVELMIPRGENIASRLRGFYEEIGWGYKSGVISKFDTTVGPCISEEISPTVTYWQTEDLGKTSLFVDGTVEEPSTYASGLRLPELQQLVEVCLVVPTNEDVYTIFEQGGSLIKDHTHTPLRDHSGVQEFRFSDPFNYSLRITANPGWGTEQAQGVAVLSGENILTTTEAARRLGVSRPHLTKLFDEGELRGVFRTGTARRIPESSVIEYIEGRGEKS